MKREGWMGLFRWPVEWLTNQIKPIQDDVLIHIKS
jgi:hypothetical protein